MEVWEGAILIVGGLWLVGHVSRSNMNHPVNVAKAAGFPRFTASNPNGTGSIAGPVVAGENGTSGFQGAPASPPPAASGSGKSGCCGGFGF